MVNDVWDVNVNTPEDKKGIVAEFALAEPKAVVFTELSIVFRLDAENALKLAAALSARLSARDERVN